MQFASDFKFLALADDNTLVSFDPSSPDQVMSLSVTGLEGDLLGIDTRPANGLIYGLTTTNDIYTINPNSGAVTFVTALSVPFEGRTISGFDFNPAADRLRLVGDNDQNFRINVDTGEVIVDGTLAFGAGDVNEGEDPSVTAAAYTNAFAGATATQLYDIDEQQDVLLLQDPPNDGGLMTIGDLGINFDTLGGFDIISSPNGENAAFAVSNATLYNVDLATGAATSLGMIGTDADLSLQGLATVPKAAIIPDVAADSQFIALTDDNTLVSFDPSNPEQVMSLSVTGIEGVLLGIDTRPADGLIYGLTTANQIYTIDPNGFDSGRFDGTFTLTDEEEALLGDGALYVNLHTDSFNGGELRGQIDVQLENGMATGISIEESQEVGEVVPPDSPAMGSFDVIYDDATNALTITGTFNNLSSPLFPVGPEAGVEGNPQSAVHLHNGVAGENGPIIRTLTTTDNVATLVSTLSQPFEGGTISGFDFNPAADRLRLVGDNDQSFRINVDTGEVIVDGNLAFVAGDVNESVNPNITAAAYTNAFAGATATQLYDIDTLLNTLVLQNPPNDGGLMTIGDLGINFDTLGGFDIISSPDGENAAFAITNSTLYSIDLTTGAATSLGMIGSDASINFQGLATLANSVSRDTLDFETVGEVDLAAGTVITDQFAADFGFTISTDSQFGAMIFDTANPTGGDFDLASDTLGNVLIISEDGDGTDPDDAATGGTISFEFDDLVGIAAVGLLDIEEAGSSVTLFDDAGDIIEEVEIPALNNGAFQQLGINVTNVARMDIMLSSSGAVAEVDFLPEMSGSIA